MPTILFATGNNQKFLIAQEAFRESHITLVQKPVEIDEVQSEDAEYIIRDKARRAYEILQQPLVVSDDSWSVPGLNGFPGPYMKSMDHWLTPQNWLDLTARLTDRRIILTQQLAYQDKDQLRLFRQDYTGTILTEARGKQGATLQKVITMPGDNGLSIAEVYDKGIQYADREVIEGWRAFIAWVHTLPHLTDK